MCMSGLVRDIMQWILVLPRLLSYAVLSSLRCMCEWEAWHRVFYCRAFSSILPALLLLLQILLLLLSPCASLIFSWLSLAAVFCCTVFYCQAFYCSVFYCHVFYCRVFFAMCFISECFCCFLLQCVLLPCVWLLCVLLPCEYCRVFYCHVCLCKVMKCSAVHHQSIQSPTSPAPRPRITLSPPLAAGVITTVWGSRLGRDGPSGRAGDSLCLLLPGARNPIQETGSWNARSEMAA